MCTHRFKGKNRTSLSKLLFNTFLFPPSSSPAAHVWAPFPSLPFPSLPFPQHWRWLALRQLLLGWGRAGQGSGRLLPASSLLLLSAPVGAMAGQALPILTDTHKGRGGAATRTLTRVCWACPSDGLSEAENSANLHSFS